MCITLGGFTERFTQVRGIFLYIRAPQNVACLTERDLKSNTI